MMILVLETLFSCGLHHTYLVDLTESRLKECCLTLFRALVGSSSRVLPWSIAVFYLYE